MDARQILAYGFLSGHWVIMALTRRERRRIRELRNDGYLARNNPLTAPILVLLERTAEERPEWFTVFLTMAHSGEAESTYERIHDIEGVNMTETAPLYEMLGRFDDGDGLNNTKVLTALVRYGLSKKAREIAAMADVSVSLVNNVRAKWEHEVRALLNDAKCLNLSGEDLYMAVTTGIGGERIIKRLDELRMSRTSDETPGVTQGQYEQEIKNAWFDYRTKQGLRGRSPDMPIYPPRWFVEMLTQ